MRKIAIIAGTYDQATSWAKENGLQPGEYIYVTHPEKLKGRRGTNYVCVGTYMERNGWVDLIKEAELSGLNRIHAPSP